MIFLTDGFTELTTELSQLADLIRKQYGLSGKLTIKDMIKQLTPPSFSNGTVVMGTPLEIKNGGESFNLIKIPPKMRVPMTMNFILDVYTEFPPSEIVFNPSSDASEQVKIRCYGGNSNDEGIIIKATIPANTLITEKSVDIKQINMDDLFMGSITKITITY